MKMTIRSPMPHRASMVRAGLDQAASLNQLGRRQAEVAEDRVDRPRPRVEQEDEGQRRRDRRRQVRQVEGGAEDARARLDLRDQQADAQAEDHPQGDHDDDQPQRVAQRRPEQRVVVEDVVPVVQTQEDGDAEAVVLHEREVDGRDQRIREEDAEADQPGRHEGERTKRRPCGASTQSERGHRGLLRLLDVTVDLVGRLLQTGLQILHLAGLVLVAEVLQGRSGTSPPLTDAGGVLEYGFCAMSRNVLKPGSAVQVGRLQRGERGRHVVDRVGEGDDRPRCRSS